MKATPKRPLRRITERDGRTTLILKSRKPQRERLALRVERGSSLLPGGLVWSIGPKKSIGTSR